MRENMKYKYGPLVWNCNNDDDESGNFYWYGDPCVGYDEIGIPIDSRGFQCLSMDSPVHPLYQPKETSFHSQLDAHLPTIADFTAWFEEHFLIIDDIKIARLILSWWEKQSKHGTQNALWKQAIDTYRTKQRLVAELWPDLAK
jgi:hypothetical protein